MYLFQNELPNNGLKSNKLDGSFFLLPKNECFIILASCTTSVLCKSFQRTLFFIRFYLRTNLVLLEVSFVLESGCKGMTFS